MAFLGHGDIHRKPDEAKECAGRSGFKLGRLKGLNGTA